MNCRKKSRYAVQSQIFTKITQTVLSKISLLHYKLPTSLNYIHIFFFNQGSSGGLPTLGIQDVLRAILVELDD